MLFAFQPCRLVVFNSRWSRKRVIDLIHPLNRDQIEFVREQIICCGAIVMARFSCMGLLGSHVICVGPRFTIRGCRFEGSKPHPHTRGYRVTEGFIRLPRVPGGTSTNEKKKKVLQWLSFTVLGDNWGKWGDLQISLLGNGIQILIFGNRR